MFFIDSYLTKLLYSTMQVESSYINAQKWFNKIQDDREPMTSLEQEDYNNNPAKKNVVQSHIHARKVLVSYA